MLVNILAVCVVPSCMLHFFKRGCFVQEPKTRSFTSLVNVSCVVTVYIPSFFLYMNERDRIAASKLQGTQTKGLLPLTNPLL